MTTIEKTVDVLTDAIDSTSATLASVMQMASDLDARITAIEGGPPSQAGVGRSDSQPVDARVPARRSVTAGLVGGGDMLEAALTWEIGRLSAAAAIDDMDVAISIDGRVITADTKVEIRLTERRS